MTLPLWILPRSKKTSRKAERKSLLSFETLEARLVPTVSLPDLAALSGAPTSGTVDTWSSLSTFDPNSATVDAGGGSSTTPSISEWTHSAAPGESIVVTGANFDAETVFWIYGQTTSLDAILLRAAVQNINTDTLQAQITLPTELQPGSEYALWAMNSSYASDPVAINDTEAWWISQSTELPNKTFTIHGQHLTSTQGNWTTGDPGAAPSAVYYRAGSSGGFTAATITETSPYSVTFNTASTLSGGNYEFWINNRIGGLLGWSKLELTLSSIITTETSDGVVPSSLSDSLTADVLALLDVGDNETVTQSKATHNVAILQGLINDRYTINDSTIQTIELPAGTIPINAFINLAPSYDGHNIKLEGVSQSGTIIKWVGNEEVTPKYMFYNEHELNNYTISNLTIDNGAVLDSNPDANGSTNDEQYVGGAQPFRLKNLLNNFRLDHVSIYSESLEAIHIQNYNDESLDEFDGVYISHSSFYTPGLSLSSGKNLVVYDNHFYATNDARHLLFTSDINNASISDNTAESYFAQIYREEHSNADPTAEYLATHRNSGANFGRRFFWSAFNGGNVSLERNTSRFLGNRLFTNNEEGSYDIADQGEGYDVNGGEQYAWDSSSAIGFTANPTLTSGTTLEFDSADVADLSTTLLPSGINVALLTYGDEDFYAVVISGAGAGQIRHVIGYASASGTDTFTLDSAFGIPLSTSGPDISVVMITTLFNRVTVYDNTIVGMPGNRVGLDDYVGDIGISLFYNTYNFAVADNRINDMRWGIGINGVSGVIAETSNQLLGVASNNLIIGNQITNARKGLVLQVQNFDTNDGDSEDPQGVNTTVFGNVIRGNILKQINDVGIQVAYARSDGNWESSHLVNTNIIEWNNITLGDVTGASAIESPQPIGIDLLYSVNFNNVTPDNNFAPVRGLFLHRNTIINTLPINGESEDPSSIGLRVGMGRIAVGTAEDEEENIYVVGEDDPQQVILAENTFSGFDKVYSTIDEDKLLAWDGEVLIGPTGTDTNYKFIFREKQSANMPDADFLYEFDMNGDGVFDSGDGVISPLQEYSVTLDSLPANLRIRITNLDSLSTVIYALDNAVNENVLYYLGSSFNDSVSFADSTGDNITVSWDGENDEVFHVHGSSSRIVAVGGSGDDTIDASGVTSVALYLLGGGDDDLLTGGEGNDGLIGDFGNDTIIGGIGDDVIFGSDGDDVIFGDIGAVDGENNPIDSLMSGSGTDTIFGNDGNDFILSQGGNDTVFGDSVSLDGLYTFDGNGDDTIDGGDGDDSIAGGDGNDFINGAAGLDILFGDEGFIGEASVTLASGDGNDTIFGGENNDTIYGQDGNDQILGDDLGEGYTFVGSGNDVIDGGNGDDSIGGGDGNDFINGAAGLDILIGDEGFIGEASVTLASGDGNDTIFGGENNDTIYGQDGNDIIDGGDDDDLLFGGDGSDFLIGGDGADVLYGDDGEDLLLSGIITVSSGTYQSFVTSIHAEWLNSTSHVYDVRVANISGVGSGTMANGSNYLDSSTVATDAAIDTVYGEASGTGDDADDWFLVDDTTTSYVDSATDIDVLDETLTDIGLF